MRYRIKVMPYEGELIYMPQRKGWIFWKDMLHPLPITGKYQNWQLEYMETEMACEQFLKGTIESNQSRDNHKKQKQAFKNANPVKYIDIEVKDNVCRGK